MPIQEFGTFDVQQVESLKAAYERLREAADRLQDAIGTKAAVDGLKQDGLAGGKQVMAADDALLCALQDTRTALDGRERPHRHSPAGGDE